ncbi:MAG: vWA domain-containing protein [Desulfobacteraceae bacterium]|jgi:serine/threonine-protein kinase PpkA|nr:vWA domain-containing protein [Desulfobacteraceae bacterium]
MIRRINRRKLFFLTIVSTAYLLAIFWVDTAASQNCKPLLLPGKKTLFQRVITNPGANVYVSAGKKAAIVHASVKPFTIYYVYERRQVEGAEWIKVGPSASCEISGWVEASLVSEWRQSLSLVFTERAGRKPVLFFKDLDSLEKVAGSPSPADEAAKLATQFTKITEGQMDPPEEFPIIAMEPQQEAVSRQRFYLMPIFQTVELFEGVKFLEAASIDPGSWELTGNSELRTAVVFVIDTTISMKPYIERTREAVRRIYDAIETSGLSDKVAFGLVAFRSSVEKTPGLEYVSKVVSDLKDGRQRGAFEAALADTREAEVSTHSFNEDAFAGLKTALEALNWKPYQSRLIFLITDAGAIRNDDPYSTTGMNEPEIADLAAAKGVKIFVLHIKTPLGKKINNHSYAEAQYKTLTGQTDPSIGDLYVPVDATKAAVGVQTFGRLVEGVAVQMVELVRATSAGQRLQLPGQSSSGSDDIVSEAKRKAAILGYSMQLEYLGRRGKVQAPQLVTSWVSDMDLAQPDIPSFTVTVLLTKNQLSDLYQRLKIILNQAQRTKRTGAKDFFQGILSAAAQISRDPSQFSQKPQQNLGELGLLGEFLDDLPYRSNIMRLTEEDWYRMSVGQQQALVDNLKSRIKRYRQYHDDVDNWISFGASDPGDMIYRVPLSMMP